MSGIRPIETIYKGYRFRSRLEARWAIFFDALGIEWEYEKEGFDLDGVWYLPDFWLPLQECWFEVKGQKQLSYEEFQKANLLCAHTDQRVYIACGEIKIPIQVEYYYMRDETVTIYLYGYEPQSLCSESVYPLPRENAWCECPHCHKVDITAFGYTCNLPCTCHQKMISSYEYLEDHPEVDPPILQEARASIIAKHGIEFYKEQNKEFLQYLGKETNNASPRLVTAYIAARQARFEHGEKG